MIIFSIKKGLWRGKNLWKLYDKAKTPYSWHKKLFRYAKKIGIVCFSTPFDSEAVDFLENLNCPFYKVSSFEFNDFPVYLTNALTVAGTATAKVRVYAVNYNVLRVMSGMAGVAYSN